MSRSRSNRGASWYRMEGAERADIEAIAALLADDPFGAEREDVELGRYESAYSAVMRDRSNFLGVVRDDAGRIVATVQLTVIPGLSRGGSTRLQIEGLRVAPAERSQGLGTAMLEWAHDFGRSRGATLAQVTTDEARDRARAFYTGLGYRTAHVGLKRALLD